MSIFYAMDFIEIPHHFHGLRRNFIVMPAATLPAMNALKSFIGTKTLVSG